jgi:hypothetical protein
MRRRLYLAALVAALLVLALARVVITTPAAISARARRHRPLLRPTSPQGASR